METRVVIVVVQSAMIADCCRKVERVQLLQQLQQSAMRQIYMETLIADDRRSNRVMWYYKPISAGNSVAKQQGNNSKRAVGSHGMCDSQQFTTIHNN